MTIQIHHIIADLNETNSSNDKLAKLKKYKDHEQFKRVLELTYDKARFTFGITMKNVKTSREIKIDPYITLDEALEHLNRFLTRELTGNAAIEFLGKMLDELRPNDAETIRLIIGRDLKINVGRTTINKVFKGLIVKPVYKRCLLFNKETAKKIKFPAILDLKADGTYRETYVKDGIATYMSRSGEIYEYPLIGDEIKANALPDGYYFGELTVEGITNRSVGNGMIGSDDCPHEKLIYSVWEYCTEEEYTKAKNKVKGDMPSTKYIDSRNLLEELLKNGNYKHIQMIESLEVDSAIEAMEYCVKWMQKGLEGGVLKNKHMLMKDGNSADQLKMKLEIDVEVRVVGQREGKKGTKRAGKLGSLEFANDEGTVKGFASGFSDKVLDEISANFEKYNGKVFTARCNDITKGRNNEHYALSHPRWIEWRNDKDTTNTLEEMFAQKESAMLLKNIM